MLTFLNPGLLIGLVAAAIPILIHLFTRRRVKVVAFSTLRFLKEMQRRKIRYLKLRQILLLILRTLAILFLVLAFARPALKQTQGVLSAEAPSAVAIILDNTLSMGLEIEGRSMLELARQRASSILDLLHDNDEIYLIYPQRPTRSAFAGPLHGVAAAREVVESTELSDSGTDLLGAMRTAVEKLAASHQLNKEIYLISDLQRTGLDLAGAPGDSLQVPQDIKLFALQISGEERSNLTLDSVGVVNQIVERGRVTEVAATVRNTGMVPEKERLVHLYLDGKRVGQDAVSLEAGAASRVLFRIVPDHSGTSIGYARLEDDDLPQDNRRYFVFRIPEEITVLLVGDRSEDTHNLRLALRPDRGSATYLRLRQIEPAALSRSELAKADVVFLSNVRDFDDALGLSLREYVRQGGGLVIFLGSDVDVRSYNENLLSRLEMPQLTRSMGRTGATNAFLTFGRIDYTHPIFAGVFEEKNRHIESPRVKFAFDIARNTPHETIISYGNNAPFLLEGGVGEGRVLLCTTGLEESWSDLVVRGLFAPLVNRAVTYLAGRAQIKTQVLSVGAELVFRPKVQVETVDFAVEKPDGDRLRVKPEVMGGRYTVRFGATDRAGVYRVLADEQQLAAFAVNPIPQESDVTPIEPEELRSLSRAEHFYAIADAAAIPQVVRQSRYGRELWRFFLVLALLALLTEMLVYREKAEEELNVDTAHARRPDTKSVSTA